MIWGERERDVILCRQKTYCIVTDLTRSDTEAITPWTRLGGKHVYSSYILCIDNQHKCQMSTC